MDADTQTNLTLTGVELTRVFNIYLNQKGLSACHSLFLENTLCSDETPVLVESHTQTLESGGLTVEKESQTETTYNSCCTVFTENCISSTDMPELSSVHIIAELDTQYDPKLFDSTEEHLISNSFSQTIMQ